MILNILSGAEHPPIQFPSFGHLSLKYVNTFILSTY